MLEFTGERFTPSKELLNDEIGYEHLHRYYSILPLIGNKTVLDIACGEGYGSALLASKAKVVYGVDIDSTAVKWAVTEYSSLHDNLIFNEGSVEKIPAEDQFFDVVVSFETIEHVSEPVQILFMKEVKRVLKPDGILIISTPNIQNYSLRHDYSNEFHLKEFEKSEFRVFLNKFFNYSYHFEQGYEIISAITGTDLNSIKKLNAYHWLEKNRAVDRKYMIGVVSDREIPDAQQIASVVLQVDKNFNEIIDYIYSLQKQEKQIANTILEKDRLLDERDLQLNVKDRLLEEKNQQLGVQVQQMEAVESLLQEKDLNLSELQLRLREKEDEIQSWSVYVEEIKKENNTNILNLGELQQEVLQLQKKINRLGEESLDKDSIIKELNKKLTDAHQQFEKVSERLAEIYSSEGWKLLSIYYKLKGKYLPEGSPRYEKLKKLVNKIRGRNTQDWAKEYYANLPAKDKPELTSSPVNYVILYFPEFKSPKVSIIIPAYNGWEINYKCLSSIVNNTSGVSYEVIFADDVSTDETSNLRNYVENITIIRNETNLGFLLNCNNASIYAKGNYLVFLNNDTEVRSGWLSSLVKLMEDDPNIGLAGSKLIYPDGRLQEAGGIIWKDASGWNYGHKQDVADPMFNYVRETDYISGAAIMVRANLWKKIGGFDVRYTPAYYEDTDLAFEIRKLGYKVVYQPLSEVIHHEGFSNGVEINGVARENSVKANQLINKQKFYAKWKDVLDKEHEENAKDVFHARDKSFGRKTIVVIDHYVPHYDKDAGSRFTFQMIQLLKKLNFNIKFIGDNFYKHEPYTTTLEQMGVEVLYGVKYRDGWKQWILDNKQFIDFFYLNRPHISVKYIDFIKEHTSAKVVYFGHDLHYIRELAQYEIEKDPALLNSSEKWKAIETELMHKSDIVVTVSEKERDIIKKEINKQESYIIPTLYYKIFLPPIDNFEEREHLFFVGGFNHKPNVDAMLWFARKVFPDVVKKIPQLKLLIAGSKVTNEILSLASGNIEILGSISDELLLKYYDSVKLIVLPLRFGAGVKGKTIEALYHGVPFVSTRFGIEGLTEIEEVTGNYDNPEDFAKEVIRLYSDPVELNAFSKRAIRYSRKYFSEQRALAILNNIFQ